MCSAHADAYIGCQPHFGYPSDVFSDVRIPIDSAMGRLRWAYFTHFLCCSAFVVVSLLVVSHELDKLGWDTATASVTQQRIESDIDEEDGTYYIIEVRLQWTAAGVEVQTDEWVSMETNYSHDEALRLLVDSYATGTEVPISVEPNNPSNYILGYMTRSEAYAAGGYGFIALLFLLPMLPLWLRYRTLNRYLQSLGLEPMGGYRFHFFYTSDAGNRLVLQMRTSVFGVALFDVVLIGFSGTGMYIAWGLGELAGQLMALVFAGIGLFGTKVINTFFSIQWLEFRAEDIYVVHLQGGAEQRRMRLIRKDVEGVFLRTAQETKSEEYELVTGAPPENVIFRSKSRHPAVRVQKWVKAWCEDTTGA